MSEQKQISTLTSFVKTNSNISITTEYSNEKLPNILSLFISNITGNINSINYNEGELIITSKNYISQIDYYINSNGQLILIGENNCEIKNYKIVNGYLMYIGNE